MYPRASARFVPRLFFAVVAVVLARTAFVTLWQRYAILPNLFPNSPQGIPSEALEFVSSVGSFLISPLLLFFVLYVLGKEMDLGFMWESITGSVFLGGVAAILLGEVVTVALYFGGDPSSIASSLAAEFSDGWNLATLGISCVAQGVFDVFVAVAAIFYADYRIKNSGPDASEGEPGDEEEPRDPEPGPALGDP